MTARVTVVFAATAFASSLAVATITYATARNSLLNQRLLAGQSQALSNSQLIGTVLSVQRTGLGQLMSSVRTESNGYAVLHVAPENSFFAQEPLKFNQNNLPSGFVDRIIGGASGEQRFEQSGQPYQAFGLHLAISGMSYFEVFSLAPTQRTLGIIFTTLTLGVLITSFIGVVIGLWASRRLLRPLSRVADAAGSLATGGLDVRLQAEPDRDLNTLAMAFNDMADAVQARIEREARFASDVSHELRSPITALVAAVGVLDARHQELSERNQQAVKVLVAQTNRFERTVVELLELARLDSGVDTVLEEEVVLADFSRRVCAAHGVDDKVVLDYLSAKSAILSDRRRLERILANLVFNAQAHGGGVTAIRISLKPLVAENLNRYKLHLEVEDSGSGIPESERERIFDRFARIGSTRPKSGTGLGLALVREHAHSMNGIVYVDATYLKGARFVFDCPVVLAQETV